MDWLKHATIISVADWRSHIAECEGVQLGDHLAIVSGSLMPSADHAYPNPPFLCYSILQKDIDLSSDISYRWIHACFTAIDAGIIATYNMEIYEATMKKTREELAKKAPERQAKLIADMELDVESEENLGTVGLREAMKVAEEDED